MFSHASTRKPSKQTQDKTDTTMGDAHPSLSMDAEQTTSRIQAFDVSMGQNEGVAAVAPKWLDEELEGAFMYCICVGIYVCMRICTHL